MFGYFHPGVGSKAVNIKMLFFTRHFPVFWESQIASHGKAGRATALLGLDFTQATGEMLYCTSFLIFFGHIVTVENGVRSEEILSRIYRSRRHSRHDLEFL